MMVKLVELGKSDGARGFNQVFHSRIPESKLEMDARLSQAAG